MAFLFVYRCSCGTIYNTDNTSVGNLETHLAANPTHAAVESYADGASGTGVPNEVAVRSASGAIYRLGVTNDGGVTSTGTGGQVAALPKNNLVAVTAPATSNDSTQGYAVGSLWIDVTGDQAYQCVDATAAAAVWKQTTAAGGGGTLNHAALTSNLAWGSSGHTGTASTLAAFTAGGAATNLSTSLAGDLTGTYPTATIANNAVTNAKAADMAGFTVKANATTGTGDPTDLAVGTNTVLGRVAGNIVAAQMVTGQIANDAVDNTKIANMAQATVKGRASGAGTGDPVDLTADQVRTILANVFQGRFTSGTVNLNQASPTAIPINTENFKDSNYTHSNVTNNSRVTFAVAGVYKVHYNIGSDNANNNRTTLQTFVRLNGSTEVLPSRAFSYSRNNVDDRATNTATFLMTAAASDYIEMMSQQEGTGGTCNASPFSTWLLIEYVRP